MQSKITITVEMEPSELQAASDMFGRLAALMLEPETTPEQEANMEEAAKMFAAEAVRPTISEEKAVAVIAETITSPPPPPPPPPPTAANGKMAPPRLDDNGVQWDAALHSDPPSKTTKGAWRKRRGSGKDTTPAPEHTIDQVKANYGKLLVATDTNATIISEFSNKVSQLAADDMTVLTGGMAALEATGDPNKFKKALLLIDAMAQTHGVTL